MNYQYIVNGIGLLLVAYSALLFWAGPELDATPFWKRLREFLWVYKWVLVIAFVGSFLFSIRFN